MSAHDIPRLRRGDHPIPRDPHAVDLPWAVGRARDWLLGPTPLTVDVTAFVLVGAAMALWRLSQDPDGFSLPGWLITWAIVVAVHAMIALTWGAVRSWRAPRRAPVYYADIPPEQRTSSRPATRAGAPAQGAPARPAVPMTWQGALAPVTPIGTRRNDSGGPLTAGSNRAAASSSFSPAGPASPGGTAPIMTGSAPAGRDSALADARAILASDQPVWRRWRRKPGAGNDSRPGGPDASWLSPFPGSPNVTGTGAPPASFDRAASNQRTTVRPAPAPPTDPEIPSLAAMLRSSNLTTLSEAPLAGPSPRPVGQSAPLSGAANRPLAGAPSEPAALLAAFGLDPSGRPRPAAEAEGEGRDDTDDARRADAPTPPTRR